ncbi:hypothetical protein DM02DRAFT_600887 [Periconia macrospinosa]|uniref:Uncharacterized protein n=1 Tax=Periconia macrospinosa TaxID=97972 RepID=A0A2V1DBB8_9PLEO|nr:hypothetical protein DM02DRAFT_600887 [Periconia macrospinosa]
MSLFYRFPAVIANAWNSLTSPARPPEVQKSRPSYTDVCVVRAMLNSLRLPTELVLEILKYAQYEPKVECRSSVRTTAAYSEMGRGHVHGKACLAFDNLDKSMLQILDIKAGKAKIKELDFTFRSMDQGWTTENTHGTFNTSSWLEVSIIRPNDATSGFNAHNPILYQAHLKSPEDLEQSLEQHGASFVRRPVSATWGPQDGEAPVAWHLQANRVAMPQEYRVVWTANGHEGDDGAGHGADFIRSLRAGDVVVVWARARYPQWRCTVWHMKVTCRFDFDE